MGRHDLSAVVGKNLGTIRGEYGWTRDELARRARDVGLDWTGSIVAAIENGRRRLSLDDFLLLPLALPGTAITDLLAGESGDVQVAENAFIDGTKLVDLLTQKAKPRDVRTPGTTGLPVPNVREWKKRMAPTVERMSAVGLRDTFANLAAVQRASREATEMALARKNGLHAETIAALAVRLWGHSLTAERDQKAKPDATAKERGWVTRKLEKELLAEAKRRGVIPKKTKKGKR